ncbi:MAG: carbohydrate ABC transporter permease, partial [Cellulosilyticaceae bacterium]
MIKKIIPFILVSLIAMLVWLPLWMLLSGSFMPLDEIKSAFGPVLVGSKGMASWPLIPQYPTLRPYIELLLDSPEFFAMFWNSVKLV